jgi:hypothetical protein
MLTSYRARLSVLQIHSRFRASKMLEAKRKGRHTGTGAWQPAAHFILLSHSLTLPACTPNGADAPRCAHRQAQGHTGGPSAYQGSLDAPSARAAPLAPQVRVEPLCVLRDRGAVV